MWPFSGLKSNYFTNYTDDTTLHVVSDYRTDLVSRFTQNTQDLFSWFLKNRMKASHNECQMSVKKQVKI